MKNTLRVPRGKAVQKTAAFTSPPPSNIPPLYDDVCPGIIDNLHHHNHHYTADGLSEHLTSFWGHDWAGAMINRHGMELVKQCLDRLTAQYGRLLDASRGSGPTDYYAPDATPIIRNPAGLIIRTVEQAAARAKNTTRSKLPIVPLSDTGPGAYVGRLAPAADAHHRKTESHGDSPGTAAIRRLEARRLQRASAE